MQPLWEHAGPFCTRQPTVLLSISASASSRPGCSRGTPTPTDPLRRSLLRRHSSITCAADELDADHDPPGAALAEGLPTVERERAKPAASAAKERLDHLYASW